MKVVKGGELSITWRGKEIENPIVRFLVCCLAVIATPFIIVSGILGAILAIILLVMLGPIWIPLHWLLRSFGRKGFYRRTEDKVEIKLDAEAFSKE